MRKLGFETLQLHAGQEVEATTGSRAVPIYQTASYVFRDTNHAADLFALKEPGNIYTRLMNPTTDVLEKRVASLEGGVGALAVASGQAAITYAVQNIVSAGEEIVSASTLYGGTYNLFATTLPKYGIKTVFVDPDDVSNFERAINNKTRAVYIETIGNPGMNIADIQAVANVAHKNGIPLIVDNTFATPYLCRPIEHGADIVVHSLTKFIGGHGTSIGGIIVDSGKFDWNADISKDKFPGMNTPDESYHGIVYSSLGGAAYIVKARVQILRDMGAALSPFNAFQFIQGIETLSLRVERHVLNAVKIANYLKTSKYAEWVNYAGLEDNRYNALAKKYLPKGAGSIFTFGIKGGVEAGKRFIESLEIFSHLANVADAKSLVIHPASTTHRQLSVEQQKKAGITPDMVRLSIGLENADDLIYDLENALIKSQNR